MDFKAAKKKVIHTILVFLIITLLLLAFIINQNYKSLQKETIYNLKNQINEIQNSINIEIEKFLKAEADRPDSDYSFFNISESELSKIKGFKYSPLSNMSDEKYAAGIAGYFEINSDGKFTSPILPVSDKDTIEQQGVILSAEELDKRTAKIEALKQGLLESTESSDLLNLYQNLSKKDSPDYDRAKFSIREFILTRKVKSDEKAIQGVVLDLKTYFESLAKTIGEGKSALQNLRLTITESNRLAGGLYNQKALGEEIKPFDWLNKFNEEIKIASLNLENPFSTINFTYSVENLPYNHSITVTGRLYVFIVLFVIGGSYFIYRLFLNQLNFAEERTNFVSAVSHELKTPLTSIRMYAEMLLNGWVSNEEKKTEHYKYIFKESERLSRLINNVLDYARISNQSSMLPLEEVPAKEIIKEIEENNKQTIAEAGYSLKIVNAEEGSDVTIQVNKDAIIQTFINLIDNALKFSSGCENKVLETGFRVSNDSLSLFLRDYGKGIPEEQQERIFDLFYRPENELTRTSPGTGIGLALVKELAAKIGAEVGVKNCDPGAEFSLIFPKAANR